MLSHNFFASSHYCRDVNMSIFYLENIRQGYVAQHSQWYFLAISHRLWYINIQRLMTLKMFVKVAINKIWSGTVRWSICELLFDGNSNVRFYTVLDIFTTKENDKVWLWNWISRSKRRKTALAPFDWQRLILYIYIYVCVCVCVCALFIILASRQHVHTHSHTHTLPNTHLPHLHTQWVYGQRLNAKCSMHCISA